MGSGPGVKLTNATALLHDGKIVATRSKTLLPTYDVFDEDRYFEPATGKTAGCIQGSEAGADHLRGHVWNDEDYWDERRTAGTPRRNWRGRAPRF